MINEIKRRLEAGEVVELECIDRDRFINNAKRDVENRILSRESIIVNRLSSYTDIVYLEEDSNQATTDGILPEELEYFKIKDPAPTFGDLVDVVVKAAKGGLLEINMLNSEFITASIPGDHDSTFVAGWRTKPEAFESSINKVESLYTETFVIESEEDELRIKQPVKSIVLANGVEIIDEDRLMLLSDSGLCLNGGAVGGIKIPLSFLKGATVTQRKTNN